MLVSNDKKFVPSSDSEDEPPDFDYLLKLPPSSGSHFMLKSEQQKFEQELENNEKFSKYFNIDTNVLNLALKSIPFNERHDIGVEWNSDELRNMEAEASKNEVIYRELLEKNLHEKKAKPKPPTLSNKLEAMKVSAPQSSKSLSKEASTVTGDGRDKESIQKWLDDILDI